MSIAVVHSRALAGIKSPQVTVEVHLSRGLPGLAIVGLPELAVRESKDRVRSAILINHLEYPLGKIIVNLAPADLPKEGGQYDLAIALGIITANKQLPAEMLGLYEFSAELSLTGELRPVRGILPIANACKEAGRKLIVALGNANEACLVKGLEVLPARNLMEVYAHLSGAATLELHRYAPEGSFTHALMLDMADIRAQYRAKRALEIAAAGAHNLLLSGPPGSGKTMLAERLPGILPPMTEQQALETAAVQSISRNEFDPGCWHKRPFRSPHHTASGIALVGGGSSPRPGEISLAHNGVLFLDELPEFDRRVLEVLREPLESGRILISRAARQAEYPADFQLVAAMNPCPCGYLGDAQGRCNCSPEQIRRYRSRISGPLLDRIDIQIEVPPVSTELIYGNSKSEGDASRDIQARVCNAYERQILRAGKSNSKLTSRELERYCQLDDTQLTILEQAMNHLELSARAIHRVLRVARTIADLEDSAAIKTGHLTEAINYRRFLCLPGRSKPGSQ
ncbi:MAG: ATP-dependent protease [Gammaproteobacteria bacterium]|nr:MAG: ATP-dependent protease [Gammaproteobacteria bacterium]